MKQVLGRQEEATRGQGRKEKVDLAEGGSVWGRIASVFNPSAATPL